MLFIFAYNDLAIDALPSPKVSKKRVLPFENSVIETPA